MKTNNLFLNGYYERAKITDMLEQRKEDMKQYFMQNLKSKRALILRTENFYPEAMTFCVEREKPILHIKILVKENGIITGSCSRDTKKPNKPFFDFYFFEIKNKKELDKEIGIMNLLLKMF